MEKNKPPFRLRAYKLLHQLMQQRKYLFLRALSKNSLSYQQLEFMQEKFLAIQSDQCMAKFIIENIENLRLLPPAHHSMSLHQINELHSEAQEISNC